MGLGSSFHWMGFGRRVLYLTNILSEEEMSEGGRKVSLVRYPQTVFSSFGSPQPCEVVGDLLPGMASVGLEMSGITWAAI